MREWRRGALAAALLVAIATAALTLGGTSTALADERVQITATDGVQLVGHLDGREGPGIVFAHTYRGDQRSWTAFAAEMTCGSNPCPLRSR